MMNSTTRSQLSSQQGADPWAQLRAFTDARIGLGRCGVAQPLTSNLDFKLAHAQARDAVHCQFEQDRMVAQLSQHHPTLALQSAAVDRETYLTRPDLGRKLDDSSVARYRERVGRDRFDLALVVGDGLSARAIHDNAEAFVAQWLNEVKSATSLSVAPIAVVRNARVAVADEIGVMASARMVLIVIGERPGLSSPDSMGVYLTYAPKVGCRDDRRNCISNIRCAGLPISDAVTKACYLIENALINKVSGVHLKDNMMQSYLPFSQTTFIADII